jgi:hypothetical protein
MTPTDGNKTAAMSLPDWNNDAARTPKWTERAPPKPSRISVGIVMFSPRESFRFEDAGASRGRSGDRVRF